MLPTSIEIQPVYTAPKVVGTTQVTIVGYGQAGNGVTGYAPGTENEKVKRKGSNIVDQVIPDDEGSGANEVFIFDFDAPDGTNGPLGGPSLGNLIPL